MIRVRVSTLESFRRVVDTEYGDEAELIESVKRGQEGGPTNWKMEAGTAFHALLADPMVAEGCPGRDELIEEGQFSFLTWDVAEAQQHVGHGLYEIQARKAFLVNGKSRPIEVRGAADWLRGLVIQGHKCKFSAPDARDYEASLQWRFYLLLHEARVFRYNLFSFKDPKEGFCEMTGITSFKFWAYPNLETECREWLSRFVEWAEARHLVPYLERQAVHEHV